jgi:hypothetical protein
MAGVRGIEPRSKVLETFILAVVLYPFKNYRVNGMSIISHMATSVTQIDFSTIGKSAIQ